MIKPTALISTQVHRIFWATSRRNISWPSWSGLASTTITRKSTLRFLASLRMWLISDEQPNVNITSPLEIFLCTLMLMASAAFSIWSRMYVSTSSSKRCFSSTSDSSFGRCVNCHLMNFKAFVIDTDSGRHWCKYATHGWIMASRPRENSFSGGVSYSSIIWKDVS